MYNIEITTIKKGDIINRIILIYVVVDICERTGEVSVRPYARRDLAENFVERTARDPRELWELDNGTIYLDKEGNEHSIYIHEQELKGWYKSE